MKMLPRNPQSLRNLRAREPGGVKDLMQQRPRMGGAAVGVAGGDIFGHGGLSVACMWAVPMNAAFVDGLIGHRAGFIG